MLQSPPSSARRSLYHPASILNPRCPSEILWPAETPAAPLEGRIRSLYTCEWLDPGGPEHGSRVPRTAAVPLTGTAPLPGLIAPIEEEEFVPGGLQSALWETAWATPSSGLRRRRPGGTRCR
ncbi:hypothetical protein NDU88_001362 [Pleurodeles waltl]|uniref:Uncharacterized protein n=1 Tax=Pleurodeles waltl TaxID=8319 RepID=A0AAV7USJ4_PLEWA|nr:hypothetical protein NDU88_001362 [Pleurodeles waltl]